MADEKKTTPEKPTNCMNCNKRLSRKSWYYRNNGYYCGKRCWKADEKKKKDKQEKKAS